MNRIRLIAHRVPTICIAIAFAFIAFAPASPAQSGQPLDKHARKIERRLAKIPTGSYVEIDFRGSSPSSGSLGQLSGTSFQFIDSDTNKTETHYYSEVAQVKRVKEYIGAGSESRHHIHLMLPVLIASGVVAAGAATYIALR